MIVALVFHRVPTPAQVVHGMKFNSLFGIGLRIDFVPPHLPHRRKAIRPLYGETVTLMIAPALIAKLLFQALRYII